MTTETTQALNVANPWQRLGAFLIDIGVTVLAVALIRMCLTYVSPGNTEQVDPEAAGTTARLTSLILYCFYNFIATAFLGGTIGKRIFKIKIVLLNGEVPSTHHIFVREFFGKTLGRFVLGDLWLFFNKNHRTFWDFFSTTVVVKK